MIKASGGMASLGHVCLCHAVRRARRAVFAAIPTLLLFGACGDSGSLIVGPGSGVEPIDTTLTIVSGDGQVGVVGQMAPEPLVVRAATSSGTPIVGVPVTWTFLAGQGKAHSSSGSSAPTMTLRTDANGVAQADWELGTRAGMQDATVEVMGSAPAPTSGEGAAPAPGNNGKKVGFRVRGKASTPDVMIITPDTVTTVPGDSVQLQALVLDQYGNAVDSVEVAWASSDPSVALVDGTGMLEATGPGSADVAATTSQVEGHAMVAVATDSTPATYPTLQIGTTSLPGGVVGQSYQQTLQAAGGDGSYGWSVSSGALPGGLALTASSGAVSGTPSTSGSFTFSVRVASGDGQTTSRSFTVAIAAAPGGGGGPALANECDAQSPAWIWCDDFDQDRLSSYFEVDDAGGRFLRRASAGLNGSSAMEGTFLAGQTGAGSLHVAFGKNASPGYVRPVDGGVLKFRDVYWRMLVRVQSGWTGGGGDKLSRAMVLASDDWRQAAIGHVWTPNSTATNLMLDPARGTDAAGNVVTTGYNDFANLSWLGTASGSTNLFSSANAGQWFCVEAHMRLNDAGQSNGLFEFWVDDALQARQAALNWLGRYDAFGINAVFFENYWNGGAPAQQSRYFDNVVVSTERIGCNGGTPGGSNPVAVVEMSGDSTVQVGATLALQAVAKDKTNATVSGAGITWASSNTSVASVGASTGVVTGVAAGSATVTAVSSNGKRASRLVTVSGASTPAPLAISTASLPTGTVGVTYSRTLGATGGDGSYTWSITSGSLPVGLLLSASQGTISGIPTSQGSSTATFQVRDGQGATASRALTLSVVSPPTGGVLHPHEPSGMTVIYDNPGTYLLNSSTAIWNTNSYNSLAQIVSDPSNPTGSGQAILRTHPGGGGAGAAKLESWSDLGTTLGGQGYSGGGLTQLYVSHRRKVPAGEMGCVANVGGNGFKFFYFGMEKSAKLGDGANEIYSTGCVNEGLVVQTGGGGTTQDFFRSLQWPAATDVTWHIEYLFIAESSNGAGDGEAYIYVNGSLIQGGHITGIQYSDPNESGRLFDGMEMYHTQHATVSGASHRWLEQEWYVSGR